MRIISAIDWGGFLEGFEDADGEAAQAGDVFRAEAGADATAVLIEVPVDEVNVRPQSPSVAIRFPR
ncbi:MAG: hypothetical protein ACYCR3_03675 [Acidithiobacillus sp.]